MKFAKGILRFFDRFEDKVREALSHAPIAYALIGAVGIVLFWKGVWEMAEQSPLLYGAGSVFVSLILLLSTGLFISFFVGDTIIISGLRSEKKLVEKTEEEIVSEEDEVEMMRKKVNAIERELRELKGFLEKKK